LGATHEISTVKQEILNVKEEFQHIVHLSAYDKERQRPWDKDEYMILLDRYVGPNFVRFPRTTQGYHKSVPIQTYFPNLNECPFVPLWDQVQRDASNVPGVKCVAKSHILPLLRQIKYYEVHGAIRGEGLPRVMVMDAHDEDVKEVMCIPDDYGWIDIDGTEDECLNAVASSSSSSSSSAFSIHAGATTAGTEIKQEYR
jgi:hypothetical protein